MRDRVFAAWGAIVEDTLPGVVFPFAFTGREYDPETGLYYYRARYYDPATGRFLSEDPLGFSAGDTNLHRYVHNGPINLRDPFGLFPDFPTYGPGGLLVVPLFDHYHTGYLNEESVNALPTEADRKRWIEEAANTNSFTAGLLYIWTQEQMRAWFADEQNYMHDRLLQYRAQLFSVLEQLAKLTEHPTEREKETKDRREARAFVNGWDDTPEFSKEIAKLMDDILGLYKNTMMELALLHSDAHAHAIEEYNRHHSKGPKLKSVEFYYTQGPKAKPISSKLTFEDDVTVTFTVDRNGKLVNQKVNAKGANPSAVNKWVKALFGEGEIADQIRNQGEQKGWDPIEWFPSKKYKKEDEK